ncbi:MAG: CpaF family protein [Selenomonas sp.]|uniref:CpaF family protein n=1 Tax=Selenomonas sp. TaxID=2053611 RepID=UPI0025FE4A79|nr:CpaF family protein [Selenomonas sp.]MCR5758499.1 CpaF family protein [Selenomonas sp.]
MSLLTRLGRNDGQNQQEEIFAAQNKAQQQVEEDIYQRLKYHIHQRIVVEMTPEEKNSLTVAKHNPREVEQIIARYCRQYLQAESFTIPRGQKDRLIADIRNEIIGLGPLEPLLQDDHITEIIVNGPKKVFVERQGKLTRTKVEFYDNNHIMNIAARILTPLGRRVDELSPLVDARLEDGSRVNIVIPPLSLVGPAITIRKFSRKPLTVDNLIAYGTLDEKMAEFLQACVKARLNILISGGTGSGKTTTLNVISSFIPEDERIVTIEDAAELKLQHDDLVPMEARPANIEGQGQITIRDLVRNALRMRPDRIIVGEVRSGEALDMLQAMNTGHDGSLTTAHANSPRDVLSRLETMVLMSGLEIPSRAIREQISSAIDLIIQQSRMRDGSRKITHITEVQRLEGNTITMQDVFRYEQQGYDEQGKAIGRFVSTGLRPGFMEKFAVNGVDLPDNFFAAAASRERGAFSC